MGVPRGGRRAATGLGAPSGGDWKPPTALTGPALARGVPPAAPSARAPRPRPPPPPPPAAGGPGLAARPPPSSPPSPPLPSPPLAQSYRPLPPSTQAGRVLGALALLVAAVWLGRAARGRPSQPSWSSQLQERPGPEAVAQRLWAIAHGLWAIGLRSEERPPGGESGYTVAATAIIAVARLIL